VLALLLLAALGHPVRATAETLYRIRIHLDDKDLLSELLRSDLDVTHIHHGEADALVTSEELLGLESRGYRLEVIREIASRPLVRGTTPEFLPEYTSYAEAVTHLQSLAASFPALTTLDSLGASHEGRAIWALKISDNASTDEDEPEVLVMGNHHAREAISVIIPLALADSLLGNYGIDAQYTEWVDEREIWIVPAVNPDGLVYSETTSYFWRKNRRNNGTSFGVDPNRNYAYQWGHDNIGSSGSGSSPVYRGPSAASEPEIQAVQNFVDAREFVFCLSFHSYGNWLLWGPGFKPAHTPDQDIFEAYGAIVAPQNGFEPGNPASGTIYLTNGVADDWLYASPTHSRILAMTPEVGAEFPDNFNPPADRIPALVIDGLDCVWPALEHADRPGRLAPPGPCALNPVPVDGDGDYDVSWSAPVIADTEPVVYELVEKTGPATVSDGLEAGTANFSLQGFSQSSTRKFAGAFSVYSGQGDNLDRFCVAREPHFVQAGDALTFRAWWIIEDGWDYAYAILSTDGGRSFVPLAGTSTTMTDPNGRNADNGITGTSGGSWIAMTFSLAAYEGQNVWLGLRYNTDEFTFGEGFYVDDIHPVQTFASKTTLSSAIGATTFPVTGRANGTYYYSVRGRDAESAWGYDSANLPVTVDLATAASVVATVPKMSLSGGAPNPFDARTEIRFDVPSSGSHSLIVYDVAGRHVRTLSQGHGVAGPQRVEWDGRDDRGRRVPAGVYFYALRSREGELRQRVVAVR
jgi:hypothetical protein